MSSQSLYTDFLSEVLPYVPNCPEVVAANAVRNAAIQLLNESHWLTYECQAQTAVATISDYDLDVGDDTEIARVLEVWFGTLQLVPKSEEELNRMYSLDWRAQVSTPRYYTQIDDQAVRLVPAPDTTTAGMITALIALRPRRDSTEIDSRVYARWLEGIAAGALSRLHKMPAQSFTDYRAAAKREIEFQASIGQAKIDRNRGQTRATVRAIPPRFV